MVLDVILVGLVDADNPTDFYAKLLSLEDVWNKQELPFLSVNRQPAFFRYINAQVCNAELPFAYLQRRRCTKTLQSFLYIQTKLYGNH